MKVFSSNWLKGGTAKTAKTVSIPSVSSVSPMLEQVEERAAILEFDANLQRGLAEEVAVALIEDTVLSEMLGGSQAVSEVTEVLAQLARWRDEARTKSPGHTLL